MYKGLLCFGQLKCKVLVIVVMNSASSDIRNILVVYAFLSKTFGATYTTYRASMSVSFAITIFTFECNRVLSVNYNRLYSLY